MKIDLLNKNQNNTLRLFNQNTNNHNSSIAFACKNDIRGAKFFLLNMDGIPCPYCGKIMVSYARYMEKLTEEALSKPACKSLKVLQGFEKSMLLPEKRCFYELKKAAELKPNATIKELMQDLRPKHLKRLQKSQYNILKEIEVAGENLSKNAKKGFNEILNFSKLLIKDDNQQIPFTNKEFIHKLFQLKVKKGTTLDEKYFNEIQRLSNKFKKSTNNISAFIVKYSAPKYTNEDIGKMLVKRSVATLEHIKPQYKGGKSFSRNYLSACFPDNNEKTNTEIKEILAKNPKKIEKIVKNLKKYLLVVIHKINKGEIKNQSSYPTDVVGTFFKESKGKVDLNGWIKGKVKVNDDSPIEKLVKKYNGKNS